jgi:signal transduction histidine kinase
LAERNEIQGVGLGLSIVSAVVDGHGGVTTLDSRPGHGTVATLTLPTSTTNGR